ncbi:MAG: ATP-binding cassette domain-containing protein [Clostridia bacterium]|nr:ATP-binding cassette domain-containing protein [Clostridia bacterium]
MIELKNVTKSYGDGFTALEDVNLQIADGEFVFIVGGSGAGKSTLAKLLIAEDKPTAGSISVNEWELHSLKKKQIPYYRRKLGIVFRDFRLFSDKTVYENVAFALRVIGEHSASVRMKVNAALRMVELSEKGKCYPGQLSGVEQQRVALARALAGSPDVIIADEPTGNIDPVQSRELMELFCRIQSRYSKTVVILTHDRELAASFGRRTVCLQRGKITEDIAAYMPGEELLAELEQANEEDISEASDAPVSDLPTESVDPVDLSATEVFTAVSATADAVEEITEAENSESADPTVDDPSAAPADQVEELPAIEETIPSDEAECAPDEDEMAEETVEVKIEETVETDVPEESVGGIESETLEPESLPTVEAVAIVDVPSDCETEEVSAKETAPEVEAVPEVEPFPETEAVPKAETISEVETISETEAVPEVETTPETEAIVEVPVDPEPEAVAAVKTAPDAVPVAVNEDVPGAEVRSITISTDALEAVLADLFNGVSVDEAIPADPNRTPAEAAEAQTGEQEDRI